MESNARRRWFRVACYALVILAAAARCRSAFQYNPLSAVWSDPARHWENAIQPVTHNPMNGIDPLGYQVWLMIAAKLTNGEPMAMAVYAALISILTPWVWYRFMRELLPSKERALAGYVLLSWLPSWIGIYSYFMAETLLVPLLGASLWMTWRSLRLGTIESYLISLLLWLAAVMTKQIAAPMAAIAVVWTWRRQGEKLKGAAVTILLTTSVLFVSAYRVHKIMNVWAPLGNGLMNEIYFRSGNAIIEFSLYHGNQGVGGWGFSSPSMRSEPFKPLSHWQSSRDGYCRFMIDLDHGAKDWKDVLSRYKPRFGQRLHRHVENMIFLLWGTSWPDNNPNRFWDNLSNETRWLWAPLVLLTSAGNLYWLRRRRWSLLPVLALVMWFCLFTAGVGVSEGRYRKPFEGLMIANALWILTGEIRSREANLSN